MTIILGYNLSVISLNPYNVFAILHNRWFILKKTKSTYLDGELIIQIFHYQLQR